METATLKPKQHKKLGVFASTAICGNDISSSCLYVSALSVLYAGQYAWIALLIVAFVLFLFRKIYGEVVGALPLNGGAYNALLNTTSKRIASLAATLTLLSYMATAVISASEGMHYAHEIFHQIPVLPAATILLGIFMVLTIIGIGESAAVASVIFIFHLASLVLLSSFCGVYLLKNGMGTFVLNNALPVKGSIGMALFFGFSAAMLGISGFESSANFVEEQKMGVFPKTLRNMWIVVSIFNPLMAFLALAIVPISDINENQNALLSFMGHKTGGPWLATAIGIDAVLVLSGAVLTSFVGVTGLMERMTLDRVMPGFLLKKTKKGSSFWIPILFFVLCVSILWITMGSTPALAGVYTIAFLSVMALFGLGNILLKINRSRLKRPERSNWLALILAIIAVIVAVAGNIILNPKYFTVFLYYFIPAILFIMIMLNRTRLLKTIFNIIQYIFRNIEHVLVGLNRYILSVINRISGQEFVFFAKHDDVATLNRVMMYIKKNEQTRKLKVVTILSPGMTVNENLIKDIEVLDRAYPELKIDFIEMEGRFGPDLIEELSKNWNIPKNFMFISSPGDKFPYKIEELGGVRLII